MKKSFSFLALFSLALFLVSFRSDGPASPVVAKATIFQYFQKNEIKEMTLEVDYKAYRKKFKTNDYIPAKLIYNLPDGTTETWDMEVRPRGRMRRQVCELPPMKFRFTDEQLKAKGLKKRNTLKMVNVCRRLSSSEQMLLREYLAYRFYNQVTDLSFRVHMVKMKYIDTDKGNVRDESYAFFIEHPADLADRTDLEELKDQNIRLVKINNDESEVFAVFQFMIGNTDWFYLNTHNVEIYWDPRQKKPIPVPYDFDYSGFVNSPYAIANDQLDISHITERYYQGSCRDDEKTRQTINLFLEKKEDIIGLIDELPQMAKQSRKYAKKYIGSFYKIIEKEKCWKREISKHCGLWPVP